MVPLTSSPWCRSANSSWGAPALKAEAGAGNESVSNPMGNQASKVRYGVDVPAGGRLLARLLVSRAREAMAQQANVLLVGGVLALALFGVATAGPLEDGQVALERNDYATALQIFRPLAEQGNAGAQFYLGSMYEQGQGVPYDTEQALGWLRKAAKQGSADAQLYLGGMYEQARGVPQDTQQAAAWYREAADQGSADAQFDLGGMYRKGLGVPQDYVQAAAWYRKAADQGSADAQVYLGGMYEQGLGVPQDYVQAAAWYRKAADQGSADVSLDAQLSLGKLYANGQGVPQDYVQAYVWFNLAAEKANWARDKRDSLAAKMTPNQIAEAQRLAQEWKPTK
jgi:TPR repeat protein